MFKPHSSPFQEPFQCTKQKYIYRQTGVFDKFFLIKMYKVQTVETKQDRKWYPKALQRVQYVITVVQSIMAGWFTNLLQTAGI